MNSTLRSVVPLAMFVIYILFCSGHLGGDIVGGWFFFFLFVTLVEKWTTSLQSSRGVDPVTSCHMACREKKRYIPSNCISLFNSMPGVF